MVFVFDEIDSRNVDREIVSDAIARVHEAVAQETLNATGLIPSDWNMGTGSSRAMPCARTMAASPQSATISPSRRAFMRLVVAVRNLAPVSIGRIED